MLRVNEGTQPSQARGKHALRGWRHYVASHKGSGSSSDLSFLNHTVPASPPAVSECLQPRLQVPSTPARYNKGAYNVLR